MSTFLGILAWLYKLRWFNHYTIILSWENNFLTFFTLFDPFLADKWLKIHVYFELIWFFPLFSGRVPVWMYKLRWFHHYHGKTTFCPFIGNDIYSNGRKFGFSCLGKHRSLWSCIQNHWNHFGNSIGHIHFG